MRGKQQVREIRFTTRAAVEQQLFNDDNSDNTLSPTHGQRMGLKHFLKKEKVTENHTLL